MFGVDELETRLLLNLLEQQAEKWRKQEKQDDKKEVKKEDPLLEYLKKRL